jgi:iron complex transport system substrate-binding protein
MRIVSLTPTATGIARALGLGPRIVGIGHADDAKGSRRPRRVARPMRRLDGRRSRTIHRAVVEAAAAGHSLMRVDAQALVSLRPDLILLTEPDDPLGPDLAEMRAIADRCDPEPTLLVLEPTSVEGVLHAITSVGAHAEVEPAAMRLVARLRSRLGRIEHRVRLRREAGHRPPRVVVLEWLDPLRASGRWVPELVRRAGGWEILGREGEPASETTWRAIAAIDPELLFLAPRGFDTRSGAAEWARIRRPAAWDRLEAVRRGQVVVLDSRLVAHPGPALLDGITVLAEVLDPEAFVDVASPTAWVPVD